MDPAAAALLVAAGFAAGLVGSVAGLASLFSYPALLAVGLPPIAANVTNTVGLFSTTVGSAAASRSELRGQRGRIVRFGALAAAGGAMGAWLLLNTDEGVFELIVPWLIALGSLLLIGRDTVRRLAARAAARGGRRGTGRGGRSGPVALGVAVALVGVYGGYFGAAAGVLMLALLSVALDESLAVSNALKNLTTGAANLVAAVSYAFLAPVNWWAAAALACGCLLGSAMGPALVRRLPERPLRWAVSLAGFALAAHLFVSALR
ncbi:sulfite exporter TauE/SafE family protein [Nocardiopsis sp. RSe5-2]|uniref:Probable membrane transporter protein n=1 Tax=Nocardiopsis endophytica TaxID=3018445 RepID=A0ABT4U9G5_9ACTN|nr:sulfite exporter TauE/SafE family protein [Nocardiopsis endophytica]MDA2813603.1 sulfite exporter TauE/SafE family protein [Nocardiopsis endophytica]